MLLDGKKDGLVGGPVFFSLRPDSQEAFHVPSLRSTYVSNRKTANVVAAPTASLASRGFCEHSTPLCWLISHYESKVNGPPMPHMTPNGPVCIIFVDGILRKVAKPERSGA